MTWARKDLMDRKSPRGRMEEKEHQAAVRRFISAWKDLTLTRKAIEARFPANVVQDALHSMDTDTLRMRG